MIVGICEQEAFDFGFNSECSSENVSSDEDLSAVVNGIIAGDLEETAFF